jgi:hypothetical protein
MPQVPTIWSARVQTAAAGGGGADDCAIALSVDTATTTITARVANRANFMDPLSLLYEQSYQNILGLSFPSGKRGPRARADAAKAHFASSNLRAAIFNNFQTSMSERGHERPI